MSDRSYNPGRHKSGNLQNVSSLGGWLQSNDIIGESDYAAVVWPKDFETVRSLHMEGGFNQITVLDDSENCQMLDKPGITQEQYISHDFAEEGGGVYDFEYTKAVSSDIATQLEKGLSLDEAMASTAHTSEKLLNGSGTAVYNTEYMEADPRIQKHHSLEEDESYVSRFEDIIERELDVDVEVYENPEFKRSGKDPYIVWGL